MGDINGVSRQVRIGITCAVEKISPDVTPAQMNKMLAAKVLGKKKPGGQGAAGEVKRTGDYGSAM